MVVIDLNEYTETATLTRTILPYEKYRITTADGRTRREVAGTYITYDLSLGNIDKTKYDQLMTLLMSTNEYVTVIMPNGKGNDDNIIFDAIFDSISDELVVEELGGERYWDNLTIQLVMVQPLDEVIT